MRFDAIQESLNVLIGSDAQLGPLGAPLVVDPFQDPEEAKALIAAALRTSGVSFEVGFPWVSAPETDLGGSTKVKAMCEVFAAEHVQVSHSVTKIDLVMRIIAVCTQRVNAWENPFRLEDYDPLRTEAGHILHKFTFSIPLNLPKL